MNFKKYILFLFNSVFDNEKNCPDQWRYIAGVTSSKNKCIISVGNDSGKRILLSSNNTQVPLISN